MFDGRLYYFKHLGLCWCLGISSLASLGADQEILDALSHIDNSVVDLKGSVDAFASATSDYLYYINQDSGVIASKTTLILDTLDVVAGVLSSSFSGGHLFVEDNQLHHDISDLRQDVRQFADTNTNLLGQVISSVNNLTNFLCYSPEYVSAFPTNIAALLVGSYLGNIHWNDIASQAKFRDLYISLYGRSPTSLELEAFRNIVISYGISQLPLTQQFLDISELEEFPSLYNRWGSNFEDIYMALYDSIPANGYVYEIADLKYYEYGTRPLLQFFEQATNDYPISQAIISDVDTEGRPRPRFSQGFVDSVESLSTSFADSVSTNIASVETNEIVPIKDNGYSVQLNKITDTALESFVDGDISSAVDGFNQQMASFIPSFDQQDKLVVSFGSIGFFGASNTVTFELNKLSPSYFAAQRFMFAVLKMIVLCLVVNGIYDFVVKDTEL